MDKTWLDIWDVERIAKARDWNNRLPINNSPISIKYQNLETLALSRLIIL